MALEHLRSHGKSTVDDAIADLPTRARAFLQRSLSLFLQLDSGLWGRVLRLAAEAFDTSGGAEEAALARDVRIPAGDAKEVLHGASFFGAMLSAHPEASAAEFVDSLVKHGLIDASLRELAAEVADLVVRERTEIAAEFEKSALRNSILPSFRAVETSVDVRLSVAENAPLTAVAVVLMALETDADCERMWFQLSKQQLAGLVARLTQTLERVDVAEQWIAAREAAAGP